LGFGYAPPSAYSTTFGLSQPYVQTHDVTPVNVSNIHATALMPAPDLNLAHSTEYYFNCRYPATPLTQSIALLVRSVLALLELNDGWV
jgi:hypothetical protein